MMSVKHISVPGEWIFKNQGLFHIRSGRLKALKDSNRVSA